MLSNRSKAGSKRNIALLVIAPIDGTRKAWSSKRIDRAAQQSQSHVPQPSIFYQRSEHVTRLQFLRSISGLEHVPAQREPNIAILGSIGGVVEPTHQRSSAETPTHVPLFIQHLPNRSVDSIGSFSNHDCRSDEVLSPTKVRFCFAPNDLSLRRLDRAAMFDARSKVWDISRPQGDQVSGLWRVRQSNETLDEEENPCGNVNEHPNKD